MPGAGLAGLISPAMAFEIDSRSEHHDVYHLHQGRDLVSVSSGYMATTRGLPYIVQSHGMIGPDSRRKAKIIDRLVTRRLLRGAST